MISVAAYPTCASKLHFQRVNFSDPLMTHYWAAVCVAFDCSDKQLTDFGGFDFDDRSPSNGKKLLKRLEEFFAARSQRVAANSSFAHEGLKALLGARGIKTKMLKSEDDYWTAAETLFPGKIVRRGGETGLYTQIDAIPKKQRKRLVGENLKRLPSEWISDAAVHQAKLSKA